MKGRSIHIIVESITDRVVLNEILDLSKYKKVSWIVARSKNMIASYVRTLRLMIEHETRILVIYDADTTDINKAKESVEMMRQFSRSENNVGNIGFYAFVPYLEANLNMPNNLQKAEKSYKQYAKEHKEQIRRVEKIQEIQTFIDRD